MASANQFGQPPSTASRELSGIPGRLRLPSLDPHVVLDGKTKATVTTDKVRWRRVDGTTIWVLLNVRQIVEGSSTRREGTAIDITDRTRAEKAAREAAALRTVAHLANAAAQDVTVWAIIRTKAMSCSMTMVERPALIELSISAVSARK